jgi:hypothetical protein
MLVTDPSRWLVLADELVEKGDPLGEIILLRMNNPEGWEKRLEAAEEAWNARHPWGRVYWWHDDRLVLHVQHGIIDHLDDIRTIPVPLVFQTHGADPDHWAVSEDFALVAHMEQSRENTGMYGPGFEDDWHYFRSLTVTRASDRRVLHQVKDVEEEWRDLEFRGQELRAKDGYGKDVTLWTP